MCVCVQWRKELNYENELKVLIIIISKIKSSNFNKTKRITIN